MPEASSEAAFLVSGLSKVYQTAAGPVHALRDVSLQIARGETLVLLGPSGSGKSTFLNILGGLDSASSGFAWFGDLDLTRAGPRELTAYRRRSVGFVFQFFNLVPSLTALENVALITEIAEDPMAPEEALGRVGLSERMHHFPSELSGGEKQRVAVARAIAKRPKVLFCDEPTGSLDSTTGSKVLGAIVDVAADCGATTLIVSHNSAIGAVADRVIDFHDGAIARVTRNDSRTAPDQVRW